MAKVTVKSRTRVSGARVGYDLGPGRQIAAELDGFELDFLRNRAIIEMQSDTGSYDGAPFEQDGGPVKFTRSSLATVTDRDGKVKWAPHNLVLNSSTPRTQDVTVEVGAKYTIECDGTGYVVLSNAGVGTVTASNPVQITATTTTLRLTVTDPLSRFWMYRSDLGGMQLTGSWTTYRKTVYPYYDARLDFDPVTLEAKGLLIEGASTNLLLNSGALATQTVVVAAAQHTLSFYGTGTVTLSGAATGPLVGTGANKRVTRTFNAAAGNLILTVTGSVLMAQLEAKGYPTSYIPTLNAQATRSMDMAEIDSTRFLYTGVEFSIFVDCKLLDAKGTVNSMARAYTFSQSATGNANQLSSTFLYGGGAFLISIPDQPSGVQGLAYKTGSLAMNYNGSVPVASSAAFDASIFDTFELGRFSYNNPLDGHIKKFIYFTRRITDSELQQRTAV